ncbi:MAG: hypothetical protein QOE33_478 [Acidobacteriota bacterium]|nr:hypothetical protein [Acidobacteriota bacterium]
MRMLTAYVLIGFFLLCCGSQEVARAQNNGPGQPTQNKEERTLQTLIEEVRLLRLTLERTNRTASLLHIALEEIRIQQEHVDFIEQRLDDVRSELASSQLSLPRFAEQLQELDTKIKEERAKADSDAERISQWESQVKDIQLSDAQQKQRDEQQRGRERQLTEQLATEKQKLEEISKRLNDLERALAKTPEER